IGQVGPLDGYMGSDRTLSITGSLLFVTFNKITANRSQRDLDLGYTFGDNHLSVIALQGVPSNGDGTESRPGNHYDWEFQYLRWLDKAGSSVQAIYHVGQTPLNDSGSLVDNFSQFYLLGNWRLPMRKNRAFNLLGGYGIDSHDKLLSPASPATPSTSGRFDAQSYFVELNYELSSKLAPYIRYDAIHSNEGDFGAIASGNPVSHNNQWLIGIAQQPARNLRISLEYAASRPAGRPNVDQIRGQLWFIY
ncbi:MAG: hypothetical protein JWN14_2620, partial [Chthonomonadales bacterium]|nr:hypothetical protein [Chthonomonadales bacterium]